MVVERHVDRTISVVAVTFHLMLLLTKFLPLEALRFVQPACDGNHPEIESSRRLLKSGNVMADDFGCTKGMD